MDPAVHTGERLPTRSDIARWTEITVTPAATGDTWDKVAQCKQVAIKTVASWPGEEHESWVRHRHRCDRGPASVARAAPKSVVRILAPPGPE